jgi:hypothetical protein
VNEGFESADGRVWSARQCGRGAIHGDHVQLCECLRGAATAAAGRCQLESIIEMEIDLCKSHLEHCTLSLSEFPGAREATRLSHEALRFDEWHSESEQHARSKPKEETNDHCMGHFSSRSGDAAIRRATGSQTRGRVPHRSHLNANEQGVLLATDREVSARGEFLDKLFHVTLFALHLEEVASWWVVLVLLVVVVVPWTVSRHLISVQHGEKASQSWSAPRFSTCAHPFPLAALMKKISRKGSY